MFVLGGCIFVYALKDVRMQMFFFRGRGPKSFAVLLGYLSIPQMDGENKYMNIQSFDFTIFYVTWGFGMNESNHNCN